MRWFDVRRKSFCLPRRPACEQNMLLDLASPVTSMDVNPARSYELAVATADGLISVYDRRALGLRGSSELSARGFSFVLLWDEKLELLSGTVHSKAAAEEKAPFDPLKARSLPQAPSTRSQRRSVKLERSAPPP